MKKFILIISAVCLFISMHGIADDQPTAESEIAADSLSTDSLNTLISQLEASFQYQTGEIDLQDGLAQLIVPDGYKFLDAEQSQYVLTELWGNPPDEQTLGMLFPDSLSPLSENFTYAIEVSYVEEGYIDDEDASSLDYDELLGEMKKDVAEANAQRVAMGYTSVQLLGWAATPYYDQENKKLHWAKELSFEGDENNTLNYNIRILGRKGYLMLNIIGNMSVLPQVQTDTDKILASVDFQDGYQYADFNPDVDKVAAYGIGSLIAGKLLAKTGFFVVLLKFWKIIAVGITGFFLMIKRRLFGTKAEEAPES